MIYQNASIHGAGELRREADLGAVRLQRVPESVRMNLDEPAQSKTLNPAGAEIRFVINSGSAKITLSSDGGPGTAKLFHGTFEAATEPFRFGSKPEAFEIKMPTDATGDRFNSLPDDTARHLRFHPRVCRLVLFHGQVLIHGIEGDIRPARGDELPEKTMLSYGTSITHGARASAFHLTYVAQTAWRLGTDLLNFGVGGACLAESAFADYLAQLNGWDFAVLALSVNMIGHGFTVGEFADRVSYFVRTMAGDNPEKPVFCVSIYPYFGDWADLQPNAKGSPDQFREAYRSVVTSLGLPNVHFIPGPEILTDISGLTVDMIHPGDLAMINMGENLAARIGSVLGAGARRGAV